MDSATIVYNQNAEVMLKLVAAQGDHATRVEDICEEANLTKGSFFHHFKSKEDLALSAAARWTTTFTSGVISSMRPS